MNPHGSHLTSKSRCWGRRLASQSKHGHFDHQKMPRTTSGHYKTSSGRHSEAFAKLRHTAYPGVEVTPSYLIFIPMSPFSLEKEVWISFISNAEFISLDIIYKPLILIFQPLFLTISVNTPAIPLAILLTLVSLFITTEPPDHRFRSRGREDHAC